MTNLDPKALGYAAASVSALGMLVLSILSVLGIYTQAAMKMAEWHMFYSVTVVGMITGMIEAAIIGFVFAYVFALVYNKYD